MLQVQENLPLVEAACAINADATTATDDLRQWILRVHQDHWNVQCCARITVSDCNGVGALEQRVLASCRFFGVGEERDSTWQVDSARTRVIPLRACHAANPS